MKRSYTLLLLYLCGAIVSGWLYVFTTNGQQLQRERKFNVSFDSAFNSVLELVKASKGFIINEDKPSGIIVYRIQEPETSQKTQNSPKDYIYINVFLKHCADKTIVYVFPRTKFGPYMREMESEFFEKLGKILGSK